MGCHTWVYKKGRKITDEEVELAIQANNDKINKFKKDADLLSYAAIDVLNNLFDGAKTYAALLDAYHDNDDSRNAFDTFAKENEELNDIFATGTFEGGLIYESTRKKLGCATFKYKVLTFIKKSISVHSLMKIETIISNYISGEVNSKLICKLHDGYYIYNEVDYNPFGLRLYHFDKNFLTKESMIDFVNTTMELLHSDNFKNRNEIVEAIEKIYAKHGSDIIINLG